MRNKIFLTSKKHAAAHKRGAISGLLKISAMLFFVSLITWQCQKDTFTGEIVGLCPSVVATSPTNGALNVVNNSLVTATFNKPMDATTVNETTFLLKNADNFIIGNVAYSGTIATFTPNALLQANTVYTATVKRNCRDLVGNIMIKDTTWSFNTGVAPAVILTDPKNGESNVALNKAIVVDFSTNMFPTTINATTFVVMQGTTPILGTVSNLGSKTTFTPTNAFKINTVYSATIRKEVTDNAGNSMLKDTTWSFATGVLPIITITNPQDGDTLIAIDTKVSATFSKQMNATTLNSNAFILKQGTTVIDGLVSYENMTATFTPTTNLQYDSEYTATITTGVADLLNKSIAKDSTWKFTTRKLLIPVLPEVVLTDPLNAAINVPIDKNISVTFSKEMDNATINSATFKLLKGLIPVLGYITYNNKVGLFTPFAPLQNGETYYATITKNAKDTSNNALKSDTTWSFTTVTALPKFNVTLSSLPIAGGTTLGGGLLDDGSIVNLSATPNAGYSFVNWTEGGIEVSTLANYSFTLSSNRTLVANFATAKLNIAVSSLPIAGGLSTGGGLFDSGTLVSVLATPNAGYTFVNWTDGGVEASTLANYSFTASSNRTLVANFATAKLNVVVSSMPIAGGLSTGGGLFDSGTLVSVLATPNAGYSFVNWTDGGVEVSTLANYSFTLSSSKTLVANYLAAKLNVAVSSMPIAGGLSTGGGLFDSGTLVSVLATPNAGYSFVNWTDGGVEVSTLANYSFTINNNKTLVANFAAIKYNVSLSSNPLIGGTTLGGGLFDSGTLVSVSATPNAGYSFNNWTENGLEVSKLANYPFTINNNKTLVANFDIIISGPPMVDLGSVGDFAIIAGSGVSNTGVTTSIKGDVGSFPTATMNGLLPGNVNGILYIVADPIVGLAKTALTAAYNDAQGRSASAISLPGQLGGLTLAPGLYVNSSTSGISGTGANAILTLDAGGNPNSVWIFKMGSTFITDAGTSIVLAGGAKASNIFWSVGTSATLGTNSIFFGNILADQSITLTTGVNLTGRALTRTGAVTLDTNTVTKP